MNEEFEKWVRSKYPDAWLHRLAGSTDYMVQSMQYMWEAWQASRKQALSEAANKCDEWATQLTAYDSAKCATAETCAEIIREMQRD